MAKTIEEKIAIMQAFADGKEIEYLFGINQNWIKCHQPLWDWVHRDYRVKALVPDSLDWSHVDRRFICHTRDGNGTVCLRTEIPQAALHENSLFWWGGDVVDATAFTSLKIGNIDWKDSLVMRPT